MLHELYASVRACAGESAMVKLDRGDALFVTDSSAIPLGFAQIARGNLFALSPETGYPPETQRIFIALLKQTQHKDSRYPTLVRAARGRMAVCLRTGETDRGLAMLEALIIQIEEGDN